MRKNLSKFLMVIIAAVLCFSLSACSGTSIGGQVINNYSTQTVDIDALYEIYKTENPEGSFEEFLSILSLYFNDTAYAASIGIQSAVSVYSSFTRRNPKPSESLEYGAAGAGVVYMISDDTVFIITNYHVIYDRDSVASNRIAHTIKVYTYGNEQSYNAVNAHFIGGSMDGDIAVLEASASHFYSDIKAAEIPDFETEKIKLGETVIAIGNPLAEGISVAAGVVSVLSEEILMNALNSTTRTVSVRVIRTDTAINGGNSGGGLFNARGKLVGIVNAKIVDEEVDNMGYAIPISDAMAIANPVINQFLSQR